MIADAFHTFIFFFLEMVLAVSAIVDSMRVMVTNHRGWLYEHHAYLRAKPGPDCMLMHACVYHRHIAAIGCSSYVPEVHKVKQKHYSWQQLERMMTQLSGYLPSIAS